MYNEKNWRDFVVITEEKKVQQAGKKVDVHYKGQVIKEKVEVVFNKIDDSRNGWVEIEEFKEFISELGITLKKEEFEHLIEQIDTDKSGKIDFEEFFAYYYNLLLKNDKNEKEVSLQGNLAHNSSLKKLKDQMLEKKRTSKLHSVVKELQYKAKVTPHAKLEELIKQNKEFRDLTSTEKFEERLLELYDDADVEDLADFIAERWEGFRNYRRPGHDGKLVMTSDNDMVDALPGDYNLVELVMTQFGNIQNSKVPRYTVVKGAKWIAAGKDEKDGKLICPSDWNGIIPIDIGTTNLLSYYGACIATDKEEKVALLQRHGTTDFTYHKGYHKSYVMDELGGNGIEKHAFHHMDCPMDDDSGFFVLGKFVNEDLHLTAFRIPKQHVLYVPPMTIHSNDHLKGTWRTMLSDSPDAPIDHVLIEYYGDEKYEPVDIKFEVSWAHFGDLDSNVVCTKCENVKNNN